MSLFLNGEKTTEVQVLPPRRQLDHLCTVQLERVTTLTTAIRQALGDLSVMPSEADQMLQQTDTSPTTLGIQHVVVASHCSDAVRNCESAEDAVQELIKMFPFAVIIFLGNDGTRIVHDKLSRIEMKLSTLLPERIVNALIGSPVSTAPQTQPLQ